MFETQKNKTAKLIARQIFEKGKPGSRRIIEVAVCKTDRIASDPIAETVEIEASISDDDVLVLYPPKYPQGLCPGVFHGDKPVIKRSDIG